MVKQLALALTLLTCLDVPVRYHSAATSGLTVTVEPGQKVVALNLDVATK